MNSLGFKFYLKDTLLPPVSPQLHSTPWAIKIPVPIRGKCPFVIPGITSCFFLIKLPTQVVALLGSLPKVTFHYIGKSLLMHDYT